MTIEKGGNWGEMVPTREGGIAVKGDLAHELGVVDHETVRNGSWLRLPLDLIEVNAVDARGRCHERSITSWLAAGSRLRGDYLIVSSTSFVKGRRIFSRSHPNDGRLEWLFIQPGMTMRQRLSFHRRTRSETHLPHPFVTVGSGPRVSRSFARPVTVRFESGDSIRGVVELSAAIHADATFTHIPVVP